MSAVTLRKVVVATTLAAIVAIGPVGPDPASPAAAGPRALLPAAVGVVEPTAMSSVVDVSKNGRFVLGVLGGRYVVRDVVRGRTVRKLPSSSAYAYYGLSDTGRYVVYTRTRGGAPTSCYTPWVRDRITNRARSAATRPNGRPLAAGWVPGGSGCPDEPSWRTQITYSDPAISGNGRYVAFCVNLTVADRLDLYVKDLRTRKVRTFEGVCSEATDAFERPQPPQISRTGRVLLLPGLHATGDEAGYNVWRPASIVLNRTTLVPNVGGAWPVLTSDGSAVLSISPNDCGGGFTSCPGGPQRYDVASATMSTLAAGDPGPGPMSRRGRYVLAISGTPGAYRLAVIDRAVGASTDLTPRFAAVGLAIPSSISRTRLSGDGRVVFLSPDTPPATWYRLRWM